MTEYVRDTNALVGNARKEGRPPTVDGYSIVQIEKKNLCKDRRLINTLKRIMSTNAATDQHKN